MKRSIQKQNFRTWNCSWKTDIKNFSHVSKRLVKKTVYRYRNNIHLREADNRLSVEEYANLSPKKFYFLSYLETLFKKCNLLNDIFNTVVLDLVQKGQTLSMDSCSLLSTSNLLLSFQQEHVEKKMLPQCMLMFRSKNLFARDGWSLLSRWVYRIRSLIPWPSVSFTCNLIWCHWCLRCWTGKWSGIALCDRTWTQRLFALTYHRTSILYVWKKILYPLFSIQSTADKNDLELGGGETEGGTLCSIGFWAFYT